ncbi:MAG: hypothetical protein IT330_09770 [Anaerolineae bacterium]|nr:hypothetical protein [Anaerolineae bacterium]
MPHTISPGERDAALRALLSDKLHAFPDVWGRAPGVLLRTLMQQVRPLPAALLRWWAAHPRGHVVIAGEGRGYVPGPQTAGAYALDCVAWAAADALLAGEDSPLEAIAHLLDHLLGCDGEEEGDWLSAGGGISPRWREVGARLRELFALGYGPTAATRVNPHAYFAWGFVLGLRDPRALNVADPRLERLLRTTLLDNDFWRLAETPTRG